MKVRTFETLWQEDHSRIFIIFAISENLSFESQIKSIIFSSIIQNWDFSFNIVQSTFSKFVNIAFSHWTCFIINSRIWKETFFIIIRTRIFYIYVIDKRSATRCYNVFFKNFDNHSNELYHRIDCALRKSNHSKQI